MCSGGERDSGFTQRVHGGVDNHFPPLNERCVRSLNKNTLTDMIRGMQTQHTGEEASGIFAVMLSRAKPSVYGRDSTQLGMRSPFMTKPMTRGKGSI